MNSVVQRDQAPPNGVSVVDRRVAVMPTQTASAVILAGGRGTRLHPYTFVLPKPLVPIGDKPILSHLLGQLRRHGIQTAHITLGHAGPIIRALCTAELGEGIQLDFSEESSPLGTIGPLSLLRSKLTSTFLVMNGDLLTDLDFRKLLQHHKRSGCMATVAYCKQKVKSQYGLLEINKASSRLVAFHEKPTRTVNVNMGVYVLEPSVLKFVPDGLAFGADDLMHALLQEKSGVAVYFHRGLWLDIGAVPDLQAAQDIFDEHRHRITGD